MVHGYHAHGQHCRCQQCCQNVCPPQVQIIHYQCQSNSPEEEEEEEEFQKSKAVTFPDLETPDTAWDYGYTQTAYDSTYPSDYGHSSGNTYADSYVQHYIKQDRPSRRKDKKHGKHKRSHSRRSQSEYPELSYSEHQFQSETEIEPSKLTGPPTKSILKHAAFENDINQHKNATINAAAQTSQNARTQTIESPSVRNRRHHHREKEAKKNRTVEPSSVTQSIIAMDRPHKDNPRSGQWPNKTQGILSRPVQTSQALLANHNQTFIPKIVPDATGKKELLERSTEDLMADVLRPALQTLKSSLSSSQLEERWTPLLEGILRLPIWSYLPSLPYIGEPNIIMRLILKILRTHWFAIFRTFVISHWKKFIVVIVLILIMYVCKMGPFQAAAPRRKYQYEINFKFGW